MLTTMIMRYVELKFRTRRTYLIFLRGERVTEKVNTMNRDPKGSFRCYFCDGLIPDAEMVIMPVPLVCSNGKVKNYKRKLHARCSVDYAEKRKDRAGSMVETDDWNDLYEYVRELMYGKGIPMPDFMRQRLQGLRVGKFIAKATNTKLLGRGYSYKTIKVAFMFSKPTILNMLQSQHFTDESHRINSVMYVVNQNIAEIDRRIRNQEKANTKLKSAVEKVDTSPSQETEYIKQERTALPIKSFTEEDEDILDIFK